MIMLWNRKEVSVGQSLQTFNEVRNTLSSNGIRYIYKIVDSTSPSYFGSSNRARTGTYGINTDYTKTYYIYVHKRDYYNAQALLRHQLNKV
jgi:putative aminopeptidase FrvX